MIRYEFIDSSIRQEDIHPGNFFEKEIKLAYDFISRIGLPAVNNLCPFCKKQHEILFRKWGFNYSICPVTWTISIETTVDEKYLFDYHNQSELSNLRASKEYQDESSIKRKDLWENLVEWIEGRVNRYLGNKKYTVIDWGSKFSGWIESISTSSFTEKLIIEKSLPPLNNNTPKSYTADIICMVDILHRIDRPDELLKDISKKIKSGGLLFITCRSGSGFDILTLLDHSETIYPLDHIFMPSPNGMKLLLEGAGFEIIEITTPGLMDIKYIKHVKEKIPKNQYFLRYIFEQDDEFILDRMQSFLQRNNLSSHLRCLARKK